MATKEDIGHKTLYGYGHNTLNDFELSEKDKAKPEYLMFRTDRIINNLVRERSHRREMMFKMRDFYDGIRDPREFHYLEDNFGIGNPSEIKFTPLVRNRIDTLIGMLSATDFDYKVTVSDNKSLFAAEQEKADMLLKNIYKIIREDSKEAAKDQGDKEDDDSSSPLTPIERLLEQAEDETNKNWRNNYVQAANDFIEDSRECPIIDLRHLREIIFEDIMVVGETVYRVPTTEVGKKPRPEVLLPENAYYNILRTQRSINQCSEFVYVRYMTKTDALQKYGHLMSDDEIREVLDLDTLKLSTTLAGYMTMEEYANIERQNESKRRSAVDRYLSHGEDPDVIRIFEVEWVANNEYTVDPEEVKNNRLISGPDIIAKKRYRQDLYRSVRIGDNVYVDMGKDDTAPRYEDDPDKVYLTFNGARFSDRGGEPYSVLWKCKDPQDMHDILLFHRDNLIASSGVRGVTMDFGAIPDFYGTDPMERALKALAMLKQGINLTSKAQEGSEYSAGGGGTHGTYDMTVNGESLSALNETIRQLDDEVSRITGVTPQMLGAIEEREAASNVRVGMNQTSMTLKKMYDTHDRVMKFVLGDMINAAKHTLREGYTGSYQEGRKIFTIIPKYFSFTNYRIQVINSSQEKMKLEEAKRLVHEAMATGSIPWDIGFKVIMLDNPNEIVQLASEVIAKQNGLAEQAQQAMEENEQLKKELEKLTKELEKKSNEKVEIEKEKLRIEAQRIEKEIAIKEKDLDRKKSADEDLKNLRERQLELEEKQLIFSENSQKQKVRRDIVS